MSNTHNQPSTLHTADGIEQTPHTYVTLHYINRITSAIESIEGIVTVSGRIIADNGDSGFVDEMFSSEVAALEYQLRRNEQAKQAIESKIDDLGIQIKLAGERASKRTSRK